MSIFSRYSQGENRVTSSILSVIELLSLPAFDYLVGRLVNAEYGLHTITNQPKTNHSVPDGIISASYKILIETKTVKDEKNDRQLRNHLKIFEQGNGFQVLLYLTPDDEKPSFIKKISDKKLVWKSFEDFDILVAELLNHESIKLSEIERFLLEQIHLMIENEGLLPSKDNVVVVAAKLAWPMYENCNIYICQPNRTFRKVDYIAFYSDGKIQKTVAKINTRHLAVTLEQIRDNQKYEQIKGRVEKYVEMHRGRIDLDSSFFDGAFQVFDLGEEILLEDTIENDCTSKNSDRRVAFTQGQRYTSLDKLKEAKKTNDLVEK